MENRINGGVQGVITEQRPSTSVGIKRSSRVSMDSAFAERISWEMSHLEPLREHEIQALLDLIRCWCEGRPWRYPAQCRRHLMLDFAERHGFSGVFGALAEKGLGRLGNDGEKLNRRYMTNLLYHDKCMAICRRLQHQAMVLEIPFTVIKGPAITLFGYGDPGVRSYSDIDILTDSRNNALRLIRAAGGQLIESRRGSSLRRRLNHPARVHARLDGWELEFCYTMERPADALFDLMHRYRERLLKIPTGHEELSVPDPSLHMVILIQHMARHLCNRFIWFFDLVVFERHNRKNLNWQWIQRELDLLELRHMGALISRFCRRHLSNTFPVIPCPTNGWNSAFHAAITSAEQICGNISLFHKQGWRKPFRYVLSPARFFLVSDSRGQNRVADCQSTQWLCARIMHTLDLSSPRFFRWATIWIAPLVLLLSRMTAHILLRAKSSGI